MRNLKAHIPDLHRDTPSGSRLKPVYEPRFNGKKVVLEQVGTLDIQEQIESFAPFTDINYMLHRLKVGDYSVLRDRQPLYGDLSSMPSNPIDAINLVHSAEANFNELDLDTKKRFNNDWRVWLANLFAVRGTDGDIEHGSRSGTVTSDPDSGKTDFLETNDS